MPATEIALVVNPESGSGEGDAVEDCLRGHGGRVTCFATGEAEAAARCGPDRIVVAGGDGSIAPAAAAAARADLPLAVVPTGTANDFARALDIPRDPDEACRLAVHGQQTRMLELGRMGDRPFVNVASAGLAPVAAREAHGLKSLLGPLAYSVGALRAGLFADPLECTVTCDGEELHRGAVWQVSIACTGAFGGGASLEADAEDGRLEVFVIPAGSRIPLVRRALGMRRGTLREQDPVDSRRAREVHLEIPPATRFNVDGEVVRTGSARFTVEARAFRVVVG